MAGNQREAVWGMGVVVVCVCILAAPLLEGNAFFGDDILFHLKRIQSISLTLSQGDFPARVYADWMGGYGSPTGIFYPSLFLYLPAALVALGFPLPVAYNVLSFLSIALAAGGAYAAVYILSRSHRISTAASAAYISSMYFLINVYERTDVGEALAMAFVPLALSATISLLEEEAACPRNCAWRCAVIGYTGVLQSHLLSSCLLAVAVSAIFLCHAVRKMRFLPPLELGKAVFWTLLLNAWYLVPFLFFYFHMETNIQETFSSLHGKAAAWQEILEMFLVWNLPQVLFLCGSLSALRSGNLPLRRKRMLALLGIGILCALMATKSFPWDALEWVTEKVNMLQLPWRMMTLGTICLAACSAAGIVWLCGHVRWQRAAIGLCCIGMSVFPLWSGAEHSCRILGREIFLVPQAYVDWERDREASEVFDDYLYRGIHEGQREAWSEAFRRDRLVSLERSSGPAFAVRWEQWEDGPIRVPVLYYPGYRIREGGSSAVLGESPEHLVELRPLRESGEVVVAYQGPECFSVADFISAGSLLLFLALWARALRIP